MRMFAQTAESIRGTSKKNEKVALLADYFRRVPQEEAQAAAILFSGRPFAANDAATLQVGGSLLWRLAAQRAEISEEQLAKIYRKFGDLGDALEAALAAQVHQGGREISIVQLSRELREIAAARGAAAKSAIISDLLARATAVEAKYILKIMLGDLRIGLRESFVEEAIARAFSQPTKSVQRANMMLGDLAATLRLAAAGKLDEARMKLFHPIGFLLAAAVQSAEEAFACFKDAAETQIEDKYDGIRGQAHVGIRDGKKTARIFSRTRDDVSAAFPELVAALRCIPGEAILDGEIVAWQRSGETSGETGRALPFSVLQQRLGRKQVNPSLQASVPAAYVAFDVLYADGELLIDKPLRERDSRLDALLAAPREATIAAVEAPQGALAFEPAIAGQEGAPAEIVRAPIALAGSAAELEKLFDASRARGNEGLMIKRADSLYTPGRRGGAWLKLKRELATLDVVVTAAEFGHGKRARVLSDYTFAVRANENDATLLNVGKAYSGLTDAEIQELTDFFLKHTVEDEGFRRKVEPLVVLEVAFNNVMISDRHSSGFALRFPRIVRIREDNSPQEIDTLATVRRIYEGQHR